MESQVKSFWRYFKRNRLAVAGLAVILVVFIIAGTASLIAPFDPGKTDVSKKL
jgi:ABC-type antimicrobial peptide transport system permease subunit